MAFTMSDAAMISYTHIRTIDLYTDFQATFMWWAFSGTQGFYSACLYVCKLCSHPLDNIKLPFNAEDRVI